MVLSHKDVAPEGRPGSPSKARCRKYDERTMRRGYRAMAKINRRLARLLEEDADDAWDGT